MSDCSLILVTRPDRGLTRSELSGLTARIREFDPDIRTEIVSRSRIAQLKLIPFWWRPTMSVSFRWMRGGRRLLPGAVHQGVPMSKARELERLHEVGIPVPDWTVISPETVLDPADWGPYVVEKPTSGHRGAHIRVRKTGRVSYQPPESFPRGHPGRKTPLLVQRFVYTGEWPTSYRVYTLFGEVLAFYRLSTESRGGPLASRWDFRKGGINIIANTKDMKIDLAVEDDVTALASRAHKAAFPHVPSLSIDVVRDAETGDLYVLETHPHGSWVFSLKVFDEVEAANNLALRSHFDVFGNAARVLVRETRRRAMVRTPFQRWGSTETE